MLLILPGLTSAICDHLFVNISRDSMVVGFTAINAIRAVPATINVVNSNPAHGEVYAIQHYVIKFVSDLGQVGGFLWLHRVPPPIKQIATIYN